MTTYTLEHKWAVWNDESGERIEVMPDRRGIGVIELRSCTDTGECAGGLVLTTAQARLVWIALGDAIRQSAGG